MNLVGEILKQTALRFKMSSPYAVADRPIQGIRSFGPYDTDLFAKDKIHCAIVFPKQIGHLNTSLQNAFTKGEGIFEGFEQWFRVGIEFSEERQISQETAIEVKRTVEEISTKDIDIVFILTSQRNPDIYREGKAILLGSGIPSQFVTAEKLNNPNQRQWIWTNIALATYAKVGGTPWVIAANGKRNEVVMGVSRARDMTGKYIVGFVTVFNQDGDFLLLHSKAPIVDWEHYVEGLRDLIVEAYHEYESLQGKPESIILHFHKRPGWPELDSIGNALQEIGSDIPYALIHLNEYSNYHLFDTGHNTYVPQAGLKVDLSRHQALLLLDGRIGDRRSRRGVPNVLEIAMDGRSTLPAEEFPRLVRQVNDFARVNWRGFNPKASPVTLNYSYLISRLVVEVGTDNWSQIIASTKLRDKAWFL